MITDEKEIMKLGKELAKKMKEHYQECGSCDYCDVIPDVVDIKTMIIKESDCICAFWQTIGHTIDDNCMAYDDDYIDCFGCDLMDKLFLEHRNAVVENSEYRSYELDILSPIRSKFWKKEGVIN